MDRLARLGDDLRLDGEARLLAVELDRIRFEASSPQASGQIELWRAAPKLQAALAGAGFDFERDEAAELAGRIKSSPIRLPLVAALDFWAFVTRNAELRERILETARLADPNPWRDRLRDPEVLKDRGRLESLAAEVDFAAQSPQLLAAMAQRLSEAGGDAAAFLRRSLAAHPRDFWLFFELGHAGVDASEKVGAFRAALAVRPESAYAHYGLGVVFYGQRQFDLALEHYRRAVELNASFSSAHSNLALTLQELGRLDEAQAEFEKAIGLDPESVAAHSNLGGLLHQRGKYEAAIGHCRRAIEIDPEFAPAHINLGVVLRTQGHLDEAIQCFRTATEVAPGNAWAWCNLGHALTQEGELEEGLEALRRGHKESAHDRDWTAPSAAWVEEAELRIALLAKLPAILAGEQPAGGPAEHIVLANLCLMHEKRFAAAARFFAGAFATDPSLAANVNDHRYNAACAAALAAGGKGIDAGDLSDQERLDLRRQAHDWLTADLAAWREAFESSRVPPAEIANSLAHWQVDPDVASLRDAAALEKLEPEEQSQWRKMWDDVRQLQERAAAASPQDGTRADASPPDGSP
jgi:tetratricopeptide (TPR) repeat protein